MRKLPIAALALLVSGTAIAQSRPHNVVLFVADGLRGGIVNTQSAPSMAALMQRGVRFTNTHSLFPTFTTANASGMATGHYLGDTGDFSNYIYTGFPVASAGGSVTPFLENDAVLGEVDAHFDGDYLNEETVLRAARQAGLSTAMVGKLGPVLIFDHTARDGQQSIVVDDSTGRAGGIPLSADVTKRLQAVGLPVQAPTRGANGRAGTATEPGTLTANVEQQDYFTAVTTEAILPWFKERGQPFVLVFWSRDPDGSQHNQGDSLGRLVPGINGPTSMAAIRNADTDLGRIVAKLGELGLADDTDVILTSDHGFSTISKESATSSAAQQEHVGVPRRHLPVGFVALDIAHGLGLSLFDPDSNNTLVGPNAFPAKGNGLLGDPAQPRLVVASNGGSDLIYLPGGDRGLAERVVAILAEQDYTSGLFVNDELGPIPGTLPFSSIGLQGDARTPHPSIVINFRSFSTGCADQTTCGVAVADTALQQGQGMHGNFSRADTRNTMGAAGPSFRRGFESAAPASNADLGRTVAELLGLKIPAKGKLLGRVLREAMPNGAMPEIRRETVRSSPDSAGRVTVLLTQSVEGTRYLDAGGYPGRTLGLPPE